MDAGDLKQKASSPIYVGFIALTLLMLIVFLVALGNQIPQLWPLATQLEEPTALSASDGSLVVVDRQKSRFTEIGSDGRVSSTSTISFDDRSKESYSVILTTEDGTYYSVANIFSDCAYIECEKVYLKSTVSNDSRLIYERSYTRDQKVTNPLFLALSSRLDRSDIVLFAQTAQRDAVEAISLVSDPGSVVSYRETPASIDDIAYLSYDKRFERLAYTTHMGNLYVYDANGTATQIEADGFCYFTNCAWDSEGRLYCINAFDHSLICVDPSQGTTLAKVDGASYYCLNAGTDGTRILCGTSDGIDVFEAAAFSQANAGTDGVAPAYSVSDAIPYSPWMIAKSIIVWLSIVYLAVCILVILVRLIRRMLKDGQRTALGRAAVAASVVVLVIAVSAFYSFRFYSFAEKSRTDSLEGLCREIAQGIEQRLDAETAAQLASGTDSDKRRAAETLGTVLADLSSVYADVNIPILSSAFLSGEEGVLLLFAGVEGYTLQSMVPDGSATDAGEAAQIAQKAQQASEAPVVQTESVAESVYFTVREGVSSSDGSVIGAVKIYSDASSLIVSYRDLCLDMFMTLLACGGGLVLIILEGGQSMRALARMRREREREGGRPVIWTTRRLNFWACFASGFDSSMSVLVAQEMLEAMGSARVDALVGLPAALGALGLFVGNVAFYFLVSRVSARRLGTMGAAAALGLFACAAWAVGTNAFWLFCLFRFGASLFLSLPASLVFSIPDLATDAADSKALFDGCKVSSISGGALGCLICGYVAQYLGNSAIYLACIVPVFIVFLLYFRHFPKKLVVEERTERAEGAGRRPSAGMLRLFLTPSMIVLMTCIVIPSMLFNGYKSVLFPLFMADGGLSKTYISTITATANVLIFAALPLLMKVKRSFDKWTFLICIMLFAAAVLAWFTINSTPAWATLSLFLLGAAYRLCSRRSYLNKAATEQGASVSKANNAYGILQQLLSAFQSPVLTALAGLGQSVACLILSGICVAGAGIFALATRNTSWRGKAVPGTGAAGAGAAGAGAEGIPGGAAPAVAAGEGAKPTG